MALNFGTLFGTLDLDSKPFDDKLGGVGSKMGGLVGVAKKAAIGIAAGLAGGAVASLMAFTGFEKGMNEVFTLLPGISDKAMGEMTGQVKDFAKDFGVLPDKVVPALYQSLSAGVPPGNVFDFLETAQMAAKGGVTDLTTAVDGISSVVNAYGDQIKGATEASDLMFTAVRLGKTNFEELSTSLFNVTPTAAALGVKFGDVTAALAAMTAQGVPTSVATTQLRQMFVELSKEGTNTSRTFEQISGKSFKEFIAGGGTVQDALGLLADHAKDTGVGMGDLFGSVEAGSAAIALTSKEGAKKFGAAMKEMDRSAGATKGAYETMDQGLSASFDRIKAAGSVFLLEVADKLAPAAAIGAEALVGILGVALSTVAPFFDTAGAAAGALAGFINSNQGPLTVVAGLIAALFIPHLIAMGVQATVSAAQVVAAWVVTKTNAIAAGAVHSAQVVAMIAKWLLLGAQATVHAAVVVAGWVATGAAAIAQAAVHVAQVGIMVAKWAFLGAQSLVHAAQVAAAWLIAMGPIALVAAAVVGLVALVIANWDKVKQFTSAAWNAVVGFVSDAGRLMWEAVQKYVQFVLDIYTGLPAKILEALGDLSKLLYNAGRSVVKGFIDGIKSMIGAVADTLGGITDKLTSWKGPPEKDRRILRPAGSLIMTGFIRGIDDQVGTLKAHLGAVADEVERAFSPTFGAPMLSAAMAGYGTAGRGSSAATGPAAPSLSSSSSGKAGMPDPEEWGRKAARAMGREAQMMWRAA